MDGIDRVREYITAFQWLFDNIKSKTERASEWVSEWLCVCVFSAGKHTKTFICLGHSPFSIAHYMYILSFGTVTRNVLVSLITFHQIVQIILSKIYRNQTTTKKKNWDVRACVCVCEFCFLFSKKICNIGFCTWLPTEFIWMLVRRHAVEQQFHDFAVDETIIIG